MSGTVLRAMTGNVKQIMQYEWKQRVTVTRKGKPAQPVIDQIRFDSTGQMQRTMLSAPPPETGGIRGRIAQGVREDVKGMMELAASYNKPAQMVEFVKKAQTSDSAAGTRLQASDVVKPGDLMTMLIDPKTHLASHVDIKTDYDGGQMSIVQDYAALPGGPNMMQTMKVSAPHKDLDVNVQSYDFVRQTAQQR